MLYLTVPLLIAVLAGIGIVVIVWRKIAFLRKLTPESHEIGETWLHDMAPEVAEWFNGIPWHEYRHAALVELEKLIRRARLIMSALDRLSDQLVRSVRRGHQRAAKEAQVDQEQRHEAATARDEEPEEVDMTDPDRLKQEEQRLIVAIAQHPKDSGLYSDLARVYMRLENYADAVESLQTAVKLQPDDERLAKRLESARRRLVARQSGT